MHPGLRAICDRYILDVANARYLLDLFDPTQLDAALQEGGWTGREVFTHMVLGAELQATAIGRLATGSPPFAAGFDLDQHNREQIAGAPVLDMEAIDNGLGRSRDAVLLSLAEAAKLDEERVAGLLAPLAGSSLHYSVHALELMRLDPPLCEESLLVNWLLHPDFSAHPDRVALQRWIYDEFLARHADDEDEDDDDEGDDGE